MNFPKISIVILNWNSINDTKQLVKSILKSNYPQNKIETIIVDNGSTDKSSEVIKKLYPDVNLIELSKNIGIPARNIGIKATRGKIIFSIDSDVSLAPDTLRNITKIIESDPKIGLVSPRVLSKISQSPLPSPLSFNFFTGTIHTLNTASKTTDLTYLPGLFHAFPRKIIKKIGLYEPKFFFYGDDLDFSLRIKKAGFKVLYIPDAVVFHGKSNSTPDIPFSIKYHHYYKALFLNIYRYGNFLQKISSTLCQLFLIPSYRLITKGENTFVSRWWGFFWNVKHFDIEVKIFLIALLISIILRIFALNWHDFWFDEAFTYYLAKLPLSDLIPAVLSDNNPPLYYLLIHFILKISHNEIALRLPSLIFNLGVIAVIISSLKGFLALKIRLIAASIFAVSPLAIYLSSEARLHSLALLEVATLTGIFLKIIKNPQKKLVTTFIIFAIISLYTTYYILLLMSAFSLIILLNRGKNRFRLWLIIIAAPLLSLLPWLLLSSQSSHNGCSCPNTFISFPASLVSPIIAGVGEVTIRSFSQLPHTIIAFFAIISVLALGFFLKGLFLNRTLALIYILPLLTLSAAGLFLPVFSPKAYSIFSPLFFLLVAVGINSLDSKTKITILAIVSGVVISLIELINPFFAGGQLKNIYSITNQNPNITVAHTSVYTYYSLSFYSDPMQKNILITQNPLSTETVKYIGGQRQNLDQNLKTLWLVDTPKWVNQIEYQKIKTDIVSKYKTKSSYTIDGIGINYLEKI